MKRLFACLVSITWLGAASAAEEKGRADWPPLAFGEVFNGRVFAVTDKAVILETDWRGDEPQDRVRDYFPTAKRGEFPPRWKIGFGRLVLTHTEYGLRGTGTRDISTKSVPLVGPDATESYWPGMANDHWTDTASNYNLISVLYEDIRNFVDDRDRVYDEKYPFSNYEFFFDLTLEKPGVCRYFVLASESLQSEIEEFRVRHDGKPWLKDQTEIPAAACEGKWRRAEKPLKPMLGVWLKDKRGQWALTDQFKEPCFNEGFHVFVQRGDWYFVTDSGKVFLSKKPDKEADRKLEAVWDDPKRPIVCAVTDADADKTFLFGRPEKKDAKPFYFVLAEKPKAKDFPPPALKPTNAPEPLKTVMYYARFLVDEKVITLPDKTDKEKEK